MATKLCHNYLLTSEICLLRFQRVSVLCTILFLFICMQWRIYDFQKEVSDLQKFLVEDQKKRLQPAFINISKHSKFNLASSNTPNLTQLTCMTWKTSTLTTKMGVALSLSNFNFKGGFVFRTKPQKPLQICHWYGYGHLFHVRKPYLHVNFWD